MDIFDLLSNGFEDKNPRIKDTYTPNDLIGEDGYLDVPNFLWEHLNKIYDQHTIRTLLTRSVFENNLEPPYKVFTEDEIWEDFNSLRYRDWGDLLSKEKWYLPLDLNGINEDHLGYLGGNYLINRNVIGLKSSDYFSQKVRWLATNRDNKGMTRTWESEKMLYYIWNAIWGLKINELNRSQARACLRLRKYMAGQFRPTVARYLYETFQAKRVLDPSAGWGDRLSGFLASSCTEHYVGIDPNSLMHPCYQKQFDFYSQRVEGKKADFICSGSENADLSKYKEYFDFIFTSPPYFDAERYSKEETQSCLKYPTVDKWLDGFFIPSLKNCWDSLAEGGRMAINIIDVYVDPKKYTAEICKPMFDFMSALPNCTYEGAIGYHIAQRKSSRSNRSELLTPMAEPIWVWCKGKADKPLFLQEDLWF